MTIFFNRFYAWGFKRIVCLAYVTCTLEVPLRFLRELNPFLHSETNFKQ